MVHQDERPVRSGECCICGKVSVKTQLFTNLPFCGLKRCWNTYLKREKHPVLKKKIETWFQEIGR